MWSEKKPSKKVNSTMFNIIQFVKNIETDHSCNVVGCNDSLIQMYLMTHWPHLPKLFRVIIVKKRMFLSCFELNLETSPYSFDKTACEFRRYKFTFVNNVWYESPKRSPQPELSYGENQNPSLSLIKSDLFTGSPCNVNA